MLRGRDELFSEVACLVGIDFKEDRRLPRRDDPPVVVLMGGRGMGKTAVLSEIARSYGNRVPRVLLDLEDERYATRPAGLGLDADSRDRADAPLLKVLRDLEWDLELQFRHQRLHFPRLSFALLAIATWQPDPELSLEEAKRVLAKARGQLSDARSEAARKDRQELWADIISEILSEPAPYPVNVFLKAAIKGLTKRTLSRSDSLYALRWYANFDPGEPGDGYEALLRLARDYYRNEEYRERAEKSLVAAFLADISAEYRGWSKLSKAGRPIVALDNVHRHEVGIRFVNLVLGHRARADTDPLVIIAAGSNSLRTQVDLGGREDGERRRPPVGWPGDYVYYRDLSRLTYDDTLCMLGTADPRRTPPDLAHLAYRLTSGLPLAVSEISGAVTGKVPAGRSGTGLPPVTVSATLTLPATGKKSIPGEPVGAYILRRLIPDSDLLDELTTFAAAADMVAAQGLVGGQDERAEQAQRFLLDNDWGASPRHFVGDPFLRALLLDNLGRRVTGMTAARVHAALLAMYNAMETETEPETGALAGSEPARLYHCMALSLVAEVAARLTETFKDPGYPADAWLDALRQVACAPALACTDGDPERRPDRRALALGAADAAIPDEIHRSVSRLLHAAWFLTDPLVLPDDRVIDELASDLKFLAKKHHAGNSVLSEAGRTWPADLRAWRRQTCDRPADGK